VHPFHKVAVGEIPLLEHDPVPSVLSDMADCFREQRVGAGPADEKIWEGCRVQVHFPAVPQRKLQP
jgi:hypothetical protein